ncbi:hypothetical protein MUB24_19955 [Lederbergia sp. NSJ-179]|uniref:hypothetical protein n=1 Tax=Lederbergia sp. NSJ-179 TaxID=2931402 RepID=UPI001FD114AC|nr:hypothetical protein [Lederbergia sp. NSJ-179]MCJ7843108.1 hypothetical protein [Lederbergia sp. NSJ-179]
MIQDYFNKYKYILIESNHKLTGSDKRTALAKTAEAIGKRGQSIVTKEFHVSKDTIRKGRLELETGTPIGDNFHARGRKKVEEEKPPNLSQDIQDIVDGESQIDPNFKATRLFTRLTVKEVRKQLILQKGQESDAIKEN